MNTEHFIQDYSRQLAHFVLGYFSKDVTFSRLNNYTWEALRVWGANLPQDKQPGSEQERIFWHLLYQLHLWDEEQLQDSWLQTKLSQCAQFLMGQAQCPSNCIGVRP